ncbi:MAG: hypothetical protein BWX82_00599 [Parcubacteria group bacterium ADurb.Bin115]|nr:MAG: hypothetical protein BWX82_00599 [Parcubacteria group bacterium ADurb.Bin115]
MDVDIQQLINTTTIIKVRDNRDDSIVFGDYYAVSRFSENQGNQINLSILESYWNNKWYSFNGYTEERQNCRLLYDAFKFFYFSFEQLRFNKISGIQIIGDVTSQQHFNDLTGVNLFSMYFNGKKCIDLLKKLGLLDANNSNWDFCKRFKETRNKLIEHNYNPSGLDIQIEPFIWSLSSTDSFMEIFIGRKLQERIYDVYIDYYEDYYKLEKIISDIIKSF